LRKPTSSVFTNPSYRKIAVVKDARIKPVPIIPPRDLGISDQSIYFVFQSTFTLDNYTRVSGFRKQYIGLALLLLLAEIVIATFVNDSFIRPFGGDFLVVILLYCLLRGFTRLPIRTCALSVLLFSYLMELLQYIHIIEMLGLGQYGLAQLIIGTTFSWEDIWAYTLGILFVIGIEIKTNLNRGKWNIL
jgi:hypothetical protein